MSLGIQVERSVIVLPAGLPGYEFSLDQSPSKEHGPNAEPRGLGTSVIVLHPELQLQLRTHDYFVGTKPLTCLTPDYYIFVRRNVTQH